MAVCDDMQEMIDDTAGRMTIEGIDQPKLRRILLAATRIHRTQCTTCASATARDWCRAGVVAGVGTQGDTPFALHLPEN